MKTFKKHIKAGLHLGISASLGYKTKSKPNRHQGVRAFLNSKGTCLSADLHFFLSDTR